VRQSAALHISALVHSTLEYKKFELMLTRCAKAYSSSCSQTVSLLQPFRRSSFLECPLHLAKINKTPYFGSSGSFEVIDLDMTKKLATSACCDRQHAYGDLPPFSRKTDQQR